MVYPNTKIVFALISIITNSVLVQSEEQCVGSVGPVNSGKDCPCVSVGHFIEFLSSNSGASM